MTHSTIRSRESGTGLAIPLENLSPEFSDMFLDGIHKGSLGAENPGIDEDDPPKQ